MATEPMFSSVTARWIRTEISARLAAIILANGTGGGLAVIRLDVVDGEEAVDT